VIPGVATLGINFRNSPSSPSAELISRVENMFSEAGVRATFEWRESAKPFLSPPGQLAAAIELAVGKVTGRRPVPGTLGGTSDARWFAEAGIEVAEFGLVPYAMHGIDERCDGKDALGLKATLITIAKCFSIA